MVKILETSSLPTILDLGSDYVSNALKELILQVSDLAPNINENDVFEDVLDMEKEYGAVSGFNINQTLEAREFLRISFMIF